MSERSTQPESQGKPLESLSPFAHADLAHRSKRGVFMYALLLVLVTGFTRVRQEHLLEASLLIVLYAALGAWRFELIRRFDDLYGDDPESWKRRFAALTMWPAGLWSIGTVLTLQRYGLGVDYLLPLLASLGLVAGAVSSLTPTRKLFRNYLLVMLLPNAVAQFMLGGNGIGLGLMLLVYIGFMLLMGKQFNQEYWSGLRNSHLLRRRAEELERAHDEVVEANAVKGQFLANVSHEIRTPMNGILGMCGLLLESGLDVKQREHAEDLDQSARALLHLMEDVLDFAKTEAGEIKLCLRDVPSRALFGDVLKPLSFAAVEKDVALSLDLDPDMPDWLHCDGDRLRQILVNLVQNAIKFSNGGEVVLGSRSRVEEDGRHWLHIWVRDEGIGISEEDQAVVFEAFRQADGSFERRHGGSGLGLAVTASLSELMGGRISVESSLGVGSTFHVHLPLSVGQDPAESTRASDRNTGDRTAEEFKMDGRILLAEDNPVNAKLATALLRRIGFTVVLAENGLEALSLWEREPVDLILMDVQMPGMDGLAATRAIREREPTRGERVPIVALTAHAREEDRELCMRAGMDDYLTKPIDRAALKATLIRWLEDEPALPGV